MNDNKRPCRNCQQLKSNHKIDSYCEMEYLPLPLQEFCYMSSTGDPLNRYLTYVPMDNLKYLEFKQAIKELHDQEDNRNNKANRS